MDREYWTSVDLKQFFRFDERSKSINSVYNAETREEIPVAERISRGKIQVRKWALEDIPKIGKKFGFLTQNKAQKVLCKYIQKGGVLKTTTTFNEARIFALNGIKTLVVGLDFECSITDVIQPRDNIVTLSEDKRSLGLYHLFYDGAPIKDVIKKTSLPTLDIIPETHELVLLEKMLSKESRREYLFKDKLLPKLKEYDVIIFDNGPSWNYLIENAITASDVIVCPLGCNLLSYNASGTNFESILDFQKAMHLKNQKIIMYATLLERSSLSQQIYAQYLSTFAEYIIAVPIRTSVKGQESLLSGKSTLEYLPKSSLSDDYYELITELWARINDDEPHNHSKRRSSRTTKETVLEE